MVKIALSLILLLAVAPSGTSMSAKHMLNAIGSITGSIFEAEMKESNKKDDSFLVSTNSTFKKVKEPSRTIRARILEERRFVLFNSRQLSGDCRKYRFSKRHISRSYGPEKF